MTLQQKNLRLLALVLLVATGMVGMAYASVPLYRLFCQVTGFGGTPQQARGAQAPGAVDGPTFKIFFNADISPDLKWEFHPAQRSVTVHAGEDKLIAYHARNLTGQTLTGTAVFNVTPEEAAPYFVKTQCFCFDRQTLTAGQDMDFPALFYLDPQILTDPDLANMREITLSYTFYPAQESDPVSPSSPRPGG